MTHPVNKPLIKEWYMSQLKQIHGGTIVHYGMDDEGYLYLVIKMPDGRLFTVWALSDEEGNQAGVLDIVEDMK